MRSRPAWSNRRVKKPICRLHWYSYHHHAVLRWGQTAWMTLALITINCESDWIWGLWKFWQQEKASGSVTENWVSSLWRICIFTSSHIPSFGHYKIKILISSEKHWLFSMSCSIKYSGKFFSPGWSGTYYIDEDDFELLMFLPSARTIGMHHHAQRRFKSLCKIKQSISVQFLFLFNKRGNNSIPKNYFKIDLRFIIHKCLVCLFDIF